MKGRPKQEKRGTGYIWMYVTDDAFEFPIYKVSKTRYLIPTEKLTPTYREIEESITDLAQEMNTSEDAIRSAVCHAERKGRKSQYRRVKKYD